MRRLIIGLALLLSAVAAEAQSELTLESVWKGRKLAKEFAAGKSSVRLTENTEFFLTDLREEWRDDNATGKWHPKQTWVGGIWSDGARLSATSVIATTYKGITWVTISTPAFGIELFPDGRVKYVAPEDDRCGTNDNTHAHAGMPARVKGSQGADGLLGALRGIRKGQPPAPIEITDGILWDAEAEAFWGGPETTYAKALHIEDVQNQAFIDSGLGWISVRFVGFHKELNWDEKTHTLDHFATAQRWKSLRNEWKADLMTMFVVDTHDGYSKANLGGPYKLVKAATAAITTHVHETGHNLGVPHSTAFMHCGTSGNSFVTAVFSIDDPPSGSAATSCVPGETIRQYSNKDPRVRYTSPYTGESFPTGDDLHDDAGIIAKNAPQVAAWK